MMVAYDDVLMVAVIVALHAVMPERVVSGFIPVVNRRDRSGDIRLDACASNSGVSSDSTTRLARETARMTRMPSTHRMFRTTLAAVALLSTSAIAHAQGHSHAAANGGQIKDIGPYEAELVVKGSDLMLYIVDGQEKKVDTAKFSASAVVLAKGNEQKTVELTPSGDNRLSGKMNFTVDGKVRATVTLKSPSGEAGKGRYSVDAAK